MKNVLKLLIVCFGCYNILGAQELENLDDGQNPNYKTSIEKYQKISHEYTILEGTTSQETYVAIDPLEEKRKRRKLRREFRAQERLWNHQVALERAKNGTYVSQYDSYPLYPINYSYNRLNYNPLGLLDIGLWSSCNW